MRECMVGRPFSPGVVRYEAGSNFEMVGEECFLDLFWLDITDEDIERVSHGRGTFGMWYSNEGDIFFLFRFGDMAWADSVFSIMQLPPDRRIRPPRLYGRRRIDLRITLVDADTGIVRAVRMASLSSSFSRKLCTSVNRQFSDRYVSEWTPAAFYSRCSAIYEAYPESSDLVRVPGCIICQTPEMVEAF